MYFLIKLTENDKRIIIALCIIIILLFVLIGYIGSIIYRIMKWQGKKLDTLVNNVVVNNIITKPRRFLKYSRKKNINLFIKQSFLGIIMILVAFLTLLIHNLINHNDWSYNPFNYKDGFATLFFIWDFNNPDNFANIFGIKVLAKWPSLMETYGKPQFIKEAIASYIIVPFGIVGICWYLIATQALIARTYRAKKLSKKIFTKDLENYNQNISPQNNLNNIQ